MLNRMFFAQNVSQTPLVGLGYGRLYNWYSILDANFASSLWRVPTYTDVITLYTYLGGLSITGGKLKETGTTHWTTPNTGASNSSGFTGWGTGMRVGSTGDFIDFNNWTPYCTSTDSGNGTPVTFALKYNLEAMEILGWGSGARQGYPVRLIKNSTSLLNGQTSTMTDYDGNTYNTICIGTQEWISKNWKCTKYNNGTPIPNVIDNTTWQGLTTGAMCAYNNDEGNV